MKMYGRFHIIVFSFVLLYALSGCSNSYIKSKPVSPASAYPSAIEQAKNDHRYFIFQSGINLYNVTSVDLDRAKQQMTVTLDKIDSSRLANVKNFGRKRYKPEKGEPAVPSNIYIYMKDSTSYTLDEPHTIPLGKVARIELLGKQEL